MIMNKGMHKAILSFALASGLALSSNAAEYLVKYKNEKAVNNIISMQTESSGIEVRGLHRAGRLVKVNVSEARKARALAAIYADKNVEYVVPNFKLKAFTAPVDVKALKASGE